MTDISSLADLRPGDIQFGPIGGAVGLGVGLGQLALGEGFHVGNLSIRHVGIVVEGIDEFSGSGPARLVQAMPHGAEEVSMTTATHWTPEHAYVRLPEDYPGQAEDAAAIARLMVSEGVAYSFASYAALAAWRIGTLFGRSPNVDPYEEHKLEAWINRRRPPYQAMLRSGQVSDGQPIWMNKEIRLPVEAICSVLVDQAWSLAGKRVMVGTAHQAVTPGAMAGQLMTRRGAIWGGPAWT